MRTLTAILMLTAFGAFAADAIVGLGGMTEAIGKLLVTAAVVEMAVAGHADDGLVVEKRELFSQRAQAQPGIEQQVPIAPSQKPDIAEDIRADVMLPDQRDVIAQGLVAEPGLGDRQRHGGTSVPS